MSYRNWFGATIQFFLEWLRLLPIAFFIALLFSLFGLLFGLVLKFSRDKSREK